MTESTISPQMQKLLDKFNKTSLRLNESKGLEARALGKDYILPLIKGLFEVFAESSDRIDAVEDGLEDLAASVASGVDPDIELLEDCVEVVIKLAGLLDETMVAAGFFAVTDKGMKNTGKAPGDLAERFLAAGAEAVELVKDIQEQIANAEQEDDEDDVDADGDQAQQDSAEPEARVVGAIGAGAKVIEPDLVEPAAADSTGEPTSNGAVEAVTTTSTEHDTDAA
jgi:hypothetical protein